jgi:hypothetical protein
MITAAEWLTFRTTHQELSGGHKDWLIIRYDKRGENDDLILLGVVPSTKPIPDV